MGDQEYIGLVVPGVHRLGSISAKIADRIRNNAQGLLDVEEVKVRDTRPHWGGLVNKATGGRQHRSPVNPTNAGYWNNQHFFLLREFSVGISGHFVVQTGVDRFWDPNRAVGAPPPFRAPQTQAQLAANLAFRADALEIRVL